MFHRSQGRILTAGTFLLVLLAGSVETASARSLVGRMAPEVKLRSGLYGVKPDTTLKSLRGEVVMVVFWSPRCTRCKKHMALIQRLHDRYEEKGLKTLAISGGKHWDTLRYMRKSGYDFGVGVDPKLVNVRRYGVRRYPATYIVGRDGRVKRWVGKLYRAIERELAVKKK